jgi:hypothetical protein
LTSSKVLTQVIPPEMIGYFTPKNLDPFSASFSNSIISPPGIVSLQSRMGADNVHKKFFPIHFQNEWF